MFFRTILKSLAILVLMLAGTQWVTTGSVPVALSAPDEWLTKVEKQVLEAIQANDTADLVVQFTGRVDLAGAEGMDWQKRGEWVYTTLQAFAEESQDRAIVELEQRGIRFYSSFGGNRLFVWSAEMDTIAWLAQLPEVESIRSPRSYALNQFVQEKVRTLPAGALNILAAGFQAIVKDVGTQDLAWAVTDTKADQFWDTFGIQGEGIVVAGIDTGVQYDHPALDQAYKCKDDPGNEACWYDPYNACGGAPCDTQGHGTAMMGAVVADDDPTLPFEVGMAPGAEWIACLGCNGGACDEYGLTACVEWALAPGGDPANRPEVVNNPWGGNGCDGWFVPYLYAWQAAGIAAVFPPGSNGPMCNTLGSPGDYQEVFAAGAYDSTRVIAGFSSRGPSCYGHDPFTKPNMSAPGVDLYLPIPENDWTNYSGTSISSSYGAGGLVLLLSCSPDLIGTPGDLFAALQNSADTPPDGNCGVPEDGEGNYTYGYGYINMIEAGVQNCDDLMGVLEGHVTESWMGIPLEGATLLISQTLVTMTDPNGYYSFTLPVGVYTVTASLDGYETQSMPDVQVGYGQASVQDFQLVQTVLELTKTVGTDPDVCATSDQITVTSGASVTYCFELYNIGELTLTLHDLADSHLGALLFGYEYDLAPQSSIIVTRTVQLSETVVNTATWTAMDEISATFLTTDLATVTVVVENPSLVLSKTVGLEPGSCAVSDVLEITTGTQVTYCYLALNNGDVPLVVHNLVDSVLGDLLMGFELTLLPGETTYLTRTVTITESVVNTATWGSQTELGSETLAMDTAEVTVIVPTSYQVFLPIVYKEY